MRGALAAPDEGAEDTRCPLAVPHAPRIHPSGGRDIARRTKRAAFKHKGAPLIRAPPGAGFAGNPATPGQRGRATDGADEKREFDEVEETPVQYHVASRIQRRIVTTPGSAPSAPSARKWKKKLRESRRWWRGGDWIARNDPRPHRPWLDERVSVGSLAPWRPLLAVARPRGRFTSDGCVGQGNVEIGFGGGAKGRRSIRKGTERGKARRGGEGRARALLALAPRRRRPLAGPRRGSSLIAPTPERPPMPRVGRGVGAAMGRGRGDTWPARPRTSNRRGQVGSQVSTKYHRAEWGRLLTGRRLWRKST